MKTYCEQEFEKHIEEHLLNSGYLKGCPETYDKELCLIPDEVITFIKNTQPKEWRKLERQYGKDARKRFLYRLAQEISRHGSLPMLRKGIKDRDAKIDMAYFKPASGMNPEHQRLFQENRFTIVRQVKYSKQNENSLDMVIFLNGLPIITMELKNSLTGQFVENAIKQYKNDRAPREPLFKYKRCLVHFAVGNEKVFMTTKLSGERTNFLPFNKDTENPVNPNGHQTAYLWEDILQPASLLTLIQSYLHVQKVTEKFYDKASHSVKEREHENFIFPRYHQLDVVRHALKYAKDKGAGHNYLVQHSTGSGKSNSIAWLAHQLAHLYQSDVTTERLFDSIIVVTDRRILDRQLQNTIKQFEQTKGVVNPINMHSRQLKDALEKGKDIIITTLQKFPVISESMTQLKGKQFAVIVDEAHSSQSGESVKHLQQTLSVNLDEAEKADEAEDVSFENEILKQIELRGKQPHISYFAFTATPKGKTLEKFGYKTEEGKFVAHHIYSMRQAIEEGFVMDVLENYTTYTRYFKLIKTIADDKRYEKSKAIRVALDYVDIHPHEIETKARIMLEHFHAKTMNEIHGRGRTMVTTRSRLHAVRYYLMFRKLLQESNLDFKPLVAFSGTVIDPDSKAEYTENGLNQLPPKVSIEDAFKMPEYRILICAEKFQTGFDEPMLHTMYVDKRLGGIHAVQTLGRLNRRMHGKDSTMILDFVNTVEDIQTSFQDYYQTTFLDEETDPNKLHSLHDQLLEYEIFTDEGVEKFAAIFFNRQEPPEKLQPVLDEVVKRFRYVSDENRREEFRSILQSYNRMYGYLSQIMPWKDTELEKLYVFGRYLNRKLPKRVRKLPNEIRDAIDLESFRIQKTFEEIQVKLQEDDGHAKGINDGVRHAGEEEKDLLSNIIKSLNDAYGLNLSEENKTDIVSIKEKLEQHPELRAVVNSNNTRENIRYKFEKVVDELLLEFVHTKLDLYKKLSDEKVNAFFKKTWFEGYIKQFDLKLNGQGVSTT